MYQARRKVTVRSKRFYMSILYMEQLQSGAILCPEAIFLLLTLVNLPYYRYKEWKNYEQDHWYIYFYLRFVNTYVVFKFWLFRACFFNKVWSQSLEQSKEQNWGN